MVHLHSYMNMQIFNFRGYNLLINIVKLTLVNREWVTLSPTSVVRIIVETSWFVVTLGSWHFHNPFCITHIITF